ncbi:MAG: hypothetical protein A2268_07605 [Candidatus Raymondbacteria bacterium RifOxyA12_full_50_37]|uniref:HDOD domain-containing protein n=1 Tax=Candidatus Raymondbacteria bacterium RIFOXYD12_FULL_49_13 TaxID=1817890 RepID=A0A1F7F503_UNCRA|nr:MAG: hypothetical protein A2248_05215 [Candidatus Raymondbacteria bacterium RIFOXYA2_FULL_49_16]OGJ90109.1 MAG: hypothetical protein A2268_07605 [Candidatus Raymondbacteria bacterium RifOxyA12_full_50_37]OGJ94656.1 MAG: hypothetical protein A2350_08410 [Candidatus Raymondbacteria bacterium RifOxyB12_full_50_8]OGJ97687.1 MAG: hypothetical protein A2453_09575 [Candidatus Raymondbacteria bacterium RIFOXYC2_FULL_50_21]OGK01744.1 MAG: hypothetical protein A2519_23045 [Candidatus Raymondbacteria b
MLEVFVGRQPIFDRQLNIFGYELLFRKYETDTKADIMDGDQATSQVILNTFMEIGLERLVGDGLAFINLTRSFVLEKYPLPIAKDRVVLEILESNIMDKALVEALKTFGSRGYQIALDDVVSPENLGPFLDIADIVKVDLMAVERSRLREYITEFRKHHVKMLAEKVETIEDFDLCKGLGFDFFQGYFLCKPNVVRGRKMPAMRLNTLRLLAELHNPNIEFQELENIVKQDVSLSYKLLRLINSAYYTRPVKVQSIRQALTLLGIKKVQAWVSLLFLSKIEEKPHELMHTAMVRAHMCELLAQKQKQKQKDTETDFTVGLFSVLDSLLDLPLAEVLSSLSFSDEINTALLQHQGRLGEELDCVLAYEKGDWDKVMDYSHNKPSDIRDAYLEALKWARLVNAEMGY